MFIYNYLIFFNNHIWIHYIQMYYNVYYNLPELHTESIQNLAPITISNSFVDEVDNNLLFNNELGSHFTFVISMECFTHS